MDTIEFTEEYLDKFFEDNQIEDDGLYECLKGRHGTIIESNESFDNEDKKDGDYMVLDVKLIMREC